MRKTLGGLLGLIALICLGLAYTQLARAETGCAQEAVIGDCADELSRKIVALYHADKQGMLSLQYQIATLTLAKETVASKSKTVEAYLLKKGSKLAEILKDKESQRLDAQLVSLYTTYSKDNDVMAARLKETYEVLSKGNYAKLKTRFRNRDLSAYIAAHRLIYKEKSPFKIEHASILWLKAQISEGVETATWRGSAPANTQEASSQIARLAGYIDPAKGKSVTQLEEKIEETEEKLRGEFIKIAKDFKDKLSDDCAKLASCPDCDGAAGVRQGAMVKAIQCIGQALQEDDALRKKRIDETIAAMARNGITVDLK